MAAPSGDFEMYPSASTDPSYYSISYLNRPNPSKDGVTHRDLELPGNYDDISFISPAYPLAQENPNPVFESRYYLHHHLTLVYLSLQLNLFYVRKALTHLLKDQFSTPGYDNSGIPAGVQTTVIGDFKVPLS